MQEKNAEYEILKRSFRGYLFPSILSLIFCQIAPVVDAVTVAKGTGEIGLCAIGLVQPAFSLFNIPAIMFGFGGGIMVSRYMGSGESEKAHALFTKLFLTLLLFSLTMVPLLYGLTPTVVRFLGVKEKTFSSACDYFRMLALGFPFYVFSIAVSFWLVNDNGVVLSMCGMITGTIINILLDHFFVIKLGWGTMGAGLGTDIGMFSVCLVFLLHVKNPNRQLEFGDMEKGPNVSIVPSIKAGLPKSLHYLILFLTQWVINAEAFRHSGMPAITVATMLESLFMLVTIIIGGIAIPVVPFSATLYGEENQSGVKSILRISCTYVLFLVVPFQILLFIRPTLFCTLFSVTETEVLQMAEKGMRIISLGFLFSAWNTNIVNSLTASGKEKEALGIVFFRDGILKVPLMFLLSSFLGVHGIWYAYLAGEGVVFLLLLCIGKMKERRPQENEATDLFSVGGMLTRKDLRSWMMAILPECDPHYHPLLHRALFKPLSACVWNRESFFVSISGYRTENGEISVILRYDGPLDLSLPFVKSGFYVDRLLNLERRLFLLDPVLKEPKNERKTVVIVEPECVTGERLCECAREAGYRVVIALAETPEHYEVIKGLFEFDTIRKLGFCDRIVRKSTWEELRDELRKSERNIIAFIAGSEISTEYTDYLADAFSLRSNDVSLITARRNKYAMKQAVKNAGLDHARGDKFTDAEEALKFIHQETHYPVMVKTPAGAASQNVFRCKDDAEVREKANIILTTLDDYGRVATYFLVEEYLSGPEYAVNLFGRTDGTVTVTSIWECRKISTKYADNLYYYDLLVDLNQKRYQKLIAYAKQVYKAVGIKLGPGHSEIKMTQRGPVMIEIGSRIMGSSNEIYTNMGMHIDIPKETVKVFATGQSDVPTLPVRHVAFALAELPYVQEGRVTAIKGLQEIRKLPSFLAEEIPLKVGDIIHPSRNLDEEPCGIWFKSPVESTVLSDVEKAHQLFKIEVEQVKSP